MRAPTVFPFNEGQARIMRNAFIKQERGCTVRGEYTTVMARQMEQAGLVTIEEFSTKYTPKVAPKTGGRTVGGLVVRITPKGREAWKNAGLVASGRDPVCLESVSG